MTLYPEQGHNHGGYPLYITQFKDELKAICTRLSEDSSDYPCDDNDMTFDGM